MLHIASRAWCGFSSYLRGVILYSIIWYHDMDTVRIVAYAVLESNWNA